MRIVGESTAYIAQSRSEMGEDNFGYGAMECRGWLKYDELVEVEGVGIAVFEHSTEEVHQPFRVNGALVLFQSAFDIISIAELRKPTRQRLFVLICRNCVTASLQGVQEALELANANVWDEELAVGTLGAEKFWNKSLIMTEPGA